jgi:hypothetical protein
MAVMRRWVSYVMPVMVEFDCDNEEVTRVVTLPDELSEERDDRGDSTIASQEGRFWL